MMIVSYLIQSMIGRTSVEVTLALFIHPSRSDVAAQGGLVPEAGLAVGGVASRKATAILPRLSFRQTQPSALTTPIGQDTGRDHFANHLHSLNGGPRAG